MNSGICLHDSLAYPPFLILYVSYLTNISKQVEYTKSEIGSDQAAVVASASSREEACDKVR